MPAGGTDGNTHARAYTQAHTRTHAYPNITELQVERVCRKNSFASSAKRDNFFSCPQTNKKRQNRSRKWQFSPDVVVQVILTQNRCETKPVRLKSSSHVGSVVSTIVSSRDALIVGQH